MDLQSLMQNVRSMTTRLQETQAQLKSKVAEGIAGGGMVKARVNGLGDLVGLEIEKEVVDPNDPEMLADLILAAVHAAKRNAGKFKTEALGALTGGVDLSSLGIDLDALTP